MKCQQGHVLELFGPDHEPTLNALQDCQICQKQVRTREENVYWCDGCDYSICIECERKNFSRNWKELGHKVENVLEQAEE